jgi:ribosomal protein S11
VLEVDGERDDLGPAAAVPLVEGLAADLGEVELDRGVQAVHVVVKADDLSTICTSLVRITWSMPFSICSTVSPMRSASRAALASASAGVGIAATSEVARGGLGRESCDSGSSRCTRRRHAVGEPDEDRAPA